MLKEQITQDLKEALLSGDKEKANTLRSMKSAILYAEVSQGKREGGLEDNAIIEILTKEAKKRQESADLYNKGGSEDRAKLELAEKAIIERYLPEQLSDEELVKIVDSAIEELIAAGGADMGRVIGLVKQRTASQAEGSRIAKIVKERLK